MNNFFEWIFWFIFWMNKIVAWIFWDYILNWILNWMAFKRYSTFDWIIKIFWTPLVDYENRLSAWQCVGLKKPQAMPVSASHCGLMNRTSTLCSFGKRQEKVEETCQSPWIYLQSWEGQRLAMGLSSRYLVTVHILILHLGYFLCIISLGPF